MFSVNKRKCLQNLSLAHFLYVKSLTTHLVYDIIQRDLRFMVDIFEMLARKPGAHTRHLMDSVFCDPGVVWWCRGQQICHDGRTTWHGEVTGPSPPL